MNVGSFWAPEDIEFNNRYGSNLAERMQVAWRGSSPLIENVGAWITSFVPRRSDVPIATIDFEALDGLPVDLMFLLIAPENAGADHLKALALIARALRSPGLAAKLRATRDPSALFSLLTLTPTSNAA